MLRPRQPYSLLLPLLLLVLSACTTLGLEPAQSLQDRVAYVTSGADALVVTATNELAAHSISSADAQYVSTAGRQLSPLLAAVVSDPDPKSAEGRLQLAESTLKQLQAYVASHQRKLTP
jgi:hypothetical protein